MYCCAGGVVMSGSSVPCHTATQQQKSALCTDSCKHTLFGVWVASLTAMPRLMSRCRFCLMGRTPVGLPPCSAACRLGARAIATPSMFCLACKQEPVSTMTAHPQKPLHLYFALTHKQELLPNDRTSCNLPGMKTGPVWLLKLTWATAD